MLSVRISLNMKTALWNIFKLISLEFRMKISEFKMAILI